MILCIGETKEQREAGETNKVCARQMEAFKQGVSDWSRVVVAYEPVWAIGTGLAATAEMAQEAHAGVRQWLTSHVSAQVADSTRIIYGGSVSATNCTGLIGQKDIDGFLVGGASLKPDFVKIIESAQSRRLSSAL